MILRFDTTESGVLTDWAAPKPGMRVRMPLWLKMSDSRLLNLISPFAHLDTTWIPGHTNIQCMLKVCIRCLCGLVFKWKCVQWCLSVRFGGAESAIGPDSALPNLTWLNRTHAYQAIQTSNVHWKCVLDACVAWYLSRNACSDASVSDSAALNLL